ncbi:hypothetical protein F53441_12320 [Fusarium austroafricanum]|uniref:Uncharacterized protein n=1 Tax=Fusarium austroafricanum TaxID=2364996 RepID=A0A8H4NWE4_9HYPO|nr:hypothetical protein F53441_12320 [Fusarium austroafricanum]
MSDYIDDQDMVTSSQAADGVVAAVEALELASSDAPSPDEAGEEHVPETDEGASLPDREDEEPETEERLIRQVGELRLIGILSPLNAVMGYYLDNPHGDGFHNVLAHSNIAVGAVLAQGDATLMGINLPGYAAFTFILPFDTASPELREVRLPLGFRRCFVRLRPVGTSDPNWAVRRRYDGPQALVDEIEATWRNWLTENVALRGIDRPVGIVAWLSLPYCMDGMEMEIEQELEDDSLG